MLISRSDPVRRKYGFAWWRMLVWLLLLLAAYSGIQYIHLIQQTWAAIQASPAVDSQQAAAMQEAFAWYIGYLVACFVVLVPCAGCILRQTWARPLLQVVALILCGWSVYRGVSSWQQWHALNEAGAALPGNTQLLDLQRILLIVQVLWAISVPVLLWLAWQLGQPAVRLQFRARRG
jgi:hypothetical protein